MPLPDTRDALKASAKLGRQVATLLDIDAAVSGVTQGAIEPALTEIAKLTTTVEKLDLHSKVMWDSRDKLGRVTPTEGSAPERDYAADETASAASYVALGARTYDVYLNENTYWKNVPAAVWNCHIGGYRVLKKWLSYRSEGVRGGPLTSDEAAHFTATAHRLAKLYLIGATLNDNYRSCRDAAYDFPREDDEDPAAAVNEPDTDHVEEATTTLL